ncbi:hypothetical protein BGZ73_002569 [Actinomortierella ambigua]|nr:hypothetical protein BGZ73_002569 [Actinomortierella ambigua]
MSIYSFDGQSSIRTADAEYQDRTFSAFVPFPTPGKARQPTWALLYDEDGLYGLDIAGNTAGRWHTETPVPLRVLSSDVTNGLRMSKRDDNDADGDDDDYSGYPTNSTGSYRPPTYGESGATSTLSNGAVAGITLGVVVLAAVMGVLAFLFWRKQRRRRQQKDANALSGRGGSASPATDSDLVKGDYYITAFPPASKEDSTVPDAHPYLQSSTGEMAMHAPFVSLSPAPPPPSVARSPQASSNGAGSPYDDHPHAYHNDSLKSMQYQLQLSHHPRPTCSTTMAETPLTTEVLPEIPQHSLPEIGYKTLPEIGYRTIPEIGYRTSPEADRTAADTSATLTTIDILTTSSLPSSSDPPRAL